MFDSDGPRASPSEVSVRSMEDMLGSLAPSHQDDRVRVDDGWRRMLSDGTGFRHEYDSEVANGSWEFYRLGHGFCLAVIDIIAVRTIPRRHLLADQLVLSAVLEGSIPISGSSGVEGTLADGYCTVYGQPAGTEMQTVYEPGTALKWVSVFIDRHSFFSATGFEAADLPPRVRDFILHGAPLSPRSVPLTHAASLAALQLKDCPYQNGFRRAFLTAKAIEIACEVLFAMAHHLDDDEDDSYSFSTSDYDRLRQARELIECELEKPPDILSLAARVGLTRQKLQFGFRVLYGDTVARVRDRLRMERALHLVRDTSESMIEIALETGYEHPASFTRAFKSTYQVAPMRMRRMAQDSVLRSRIPNTHQD